MIIVVAFIAWTLPLVASPGVSVRHESVAWVAARDRIDPDLIVLSSDAAQTLTPSDVARRLSGSTTRVIISGASLDADAAESWVMQAVAPFVHPRRLQARIDALRRAGTARPIDAVHALGALLAARRPSLPVMRGGAAPRRARATLLDATSALDALHHLDTPCVKAWMRALGSTRKSLERRTHEWWHLSPRVVIDVYRAEVVEHMVARGTRPEAAAHAAGYCEFRSYSEAAARLAALRAPASRTPLGDVSHPPADLSHLRR